MPLLGIRIGDNLTPEMAKQIKEKVSAFDARLRVVFHVDDMGNVTLMIVGP